MWDLRLTTQPEDVEALAVAKDSYRRLVSRSDLGFMQLPHREHLWQQSAERGDELRRSCQRMIVLGMGGSSLGGRALLQPWKNSHRDRSIEFLDNVDSHHFWEWLRAGSPWSDTHWVIVSKSGTTVETLTMADFVDQHLQQKGLPGIAARSTVISEFEDNALTRWAKKAGAPILEIPKDVGGRFSVLSPVGLLPAAFNGLRLASMREGAVWALDQEDLICRLTAQSLMSFARSEWITMFWAYADGLRDFGLWTQQLWAESLGKAINRRGKPAARASSPMAAVGSCDQHSILQQVMEGSRDKFIWFLRVRQSEEHDGLRLNQSLFDCQSMMSRKTMGQLFGAMATATRDALQQQGVQSLTLFTPKLDEKSMGALFMIFELVVGTLGEAHDINAFDQPGVELGKSLAREILSQ